MSFKIDLQQDAFLGALQEAIQGAFEKAAEPVIKKALAEIESDIRHEIAGIAGRLASNLSMEHNRTDLRITVHFPETMRK